MILLDDDIRAQRLIQFMRAKIPLAAAMDLHLAACDDDGLALFAPLAPNINDKGCAFGGSLTSLMTLNGWALVEMALRRRGENCDVFVAESSVRYLAPVWQDLRSEARLTADADWKVFFRTLDTRAKARIQVCCEILNDDGLVAAAMTARYVAKKRAQNTEQHVSLHVAAE